MTTKQDNWLRTSRQRPCPICGKPDWCTISADERVACCMRVESVRPAHNGGWIHRLTDPPPPRVRWQRRPQTPPPQPVEPIDWPERLRHYAGGTHPDEVSRLALELGVGGISLARLGIVRVATRRAWGFPMRDAAGAICGLRLRGDAGGKWAVAGSRQGVFLPDGEIGDLCDEVVVCEGPTDAAAVLDLDFYAVGRPSCMGCEALLADLLLRRNVVILADRDAPKPHPSGGTWRPGQVGAERLAAHLFGAARTVKLIKPLTGKDARDWKATGATHDVLRAVIDNARYWRPQ